MPRIFGNKGESKLGADLTAAGTALTLEAGGGAKFVSPVAPDYVDLVLVSLDANGNDTGTPEYVRMTALAGDVLTIVRPVANNNYLGHGAANTAQAWAYATGSGVRVANRVLAEALAGFGGEQHSRFTGVGQTWYSLLQGRPIGVGAYTLLASYQYYEGFIVESPVQIDRLGVDVSTAVAGSQVRLGLCKADAYWTPGALVWEAGTIATTSNGLASIDLSAVLTLQQRQLAPGRYFWLLQTPATVPTVRCWRISSNLARSIVPGSVYSMPSFLRTSRADAALAANTAVIGACDFDNVQPTSGMVLARLGSV